VLPVEMAVAVEVAVALIATGTVCAAAPGHGALVRFVSKGEASGYSFTAIHMLNVTCLFEPCFNT
jgi:hypothetical protein